MTPYQVSFLFSSPDKCLTAIGAPVALARNPAGYSSLGRRRQGRWDIWEREDTARKAATNFLKGRDDLCIPVEILTELVEEDRYDIVL